MSNTYDNNLPLMPTGPVEWPALYNDFTNKYEAGRTLRLVAGETIAKYKGFRVNSDGSAVISDSTSNTLGLWQSTSTPADSTGFGQTDGVMTNGGWSWTPNDRLYIDNNGDLTADTTSNFSVAVALSSTKISLIKLFY